MKIFIILILMVCFNSSFAALNSFQKEIDYDNMLRQSAKAKHYSAKELADMRQARRNYQNMLIKQKMLEIKPPPMFAASKESKLAVLQGHVNNSASVMAPKSNIFVTFIALIGGVFILVYALFMFSRKKMVG